MQVLPRSARPKRLVLVRHGRTSWNKIGRAQGHADISLDAVGVRQAKTAAKRLARYEPAMIWSSDLARARETAEHVAVATGLEICLDKRLREYDVGVRQGLTFAEFEVQYPDLFAELRAGERVVVPGAENDTEVAERMAAVLREAADGLADHDTGIVVGHGASLRTGMLAFFGIAERSEIFAGMANCAWAVLERHRNRGWQIMDYNASTLPESFELADDLSPR
jgi:glucosyl-3-phosphoglycerate phosphatase